jgi:hypothetical protein
LNGNPRSSSSCDAKSRDGILNFNLQVEIKEAGAGRGRTHGAGSYWAKGAVCQWASEGAPTTADEYFILLGGRRGQSREIGGSTWLGPGMKRVRPLFVVLTWVVRMRADSRA